MFEPRAQWSSSSVVHFLGDHFSVIIFRPLASCTTMRTRGLENIASNLSTPSAFESCEHFSLCAWKLSEELSCEKEEGSLTSLSFLIFKIGGTICITASLLMLRPPLFISWFCTLIGCYSIYNQGGCKLFLTPEQGFYPESLCMFSILSRKRKGT